MKILKFFLRFFLVLFILFFVAATIYVRIYGRSLLETALNKALGRNVVIGSASYSFPLGLNARNVSIAGSSFGGRFLDVKKINAQLSWDAVVQGRFAFDTVVLVEPLLVVDGKKASVNASAATPSAPEGAVGVEPSPDAAVKQERGLMLNEHMPQQVTLKRVVVKGGTLQYRDGLTEKGYSFDLEDVQMTVDNLVFPVQKGGQSRFSLSGRVVKKGVVLSGGRARAEGWVDVAGRNMEAEVEVSETDGAGGMSARAVSKNNRMTVTGRIQTKDLLQGIDPGAAAKASSINDLALNLLSSAGIEIGIEFAFETLMDDFHVGKVAFSGNVVTK